MQKYKVMEEPIDPKQLARTELKWSFVKKISWGQTKLWLFRQKVIPEAVHFLYKLGDALQTACGHHRLRLKDFHSYKEAYSYVMKENKPTCKTCIKALNRPKKNEYMRMQNGRLKKLATCHPGELQRLEEEYFCR